MRQFNIETKKEGFLQPSFFDFDLQLFTSNHPLVD